MRLTEKMLNDALERHDARHLPVLCVLHEKRKSLVDHTWSKGWVAVTEPTEKGCLELTHREALDLIELCGLLPVHSDSDGTVYDTPSEKFRNAFRGAQVEMNADESRLDQPTFSQKRMRSQGKPLPAE